MLLGLIIGAYWVGFLCCFAPVARWRDRKFKENYASLWRDTNCRFTSVAFETIMLTLIWPALVLVPVKHGIHRAIKSPMRYILVDKEKQVRAS